MPPYFPTNLYPRALYSGSLGVEAEMPVTAFNPIFEEVKQETFAATGKRYVTVYRREERAHVQLMGVDGYEVQRWRSLMQDWALRGKQFELLLDRFTGRVFTFANTITDQDLNFSAASYGLTASFAVAGSRTGLFLQSSGAFTLANPAGSLSAALVSSGGCVVVTMVPSFASDTGSQEHLFDTVGATNRVRLFKSGSNQVDFEVTWTTGSKNTVRWGAASWSVGATAVTLIGRFSQTSSPALWYATSSPALTVQATNMPETQAGSLGTLSNTLTVHHDSSGQQFAYGVMTLLGCYKFDYADPTILSSYFPVGRNYYDKAESLDPMFQPQRAAPTVDLWNMSFLIREGV